MSKYSYKGHKRYGRQGGFALMVAMILLVIITLLALGALRSTTLQTRMAANLYDRGLAFQTAESALMAAQVAVAAQPSISSLGGTSCTPSDDACPMVPANAWTNDGEGWRDVNAEFRPNTTRYPAVAQYHVDYLGVKKVDADDEVDQSLSSNPNQYDEQKPKSVNQMDVFRITVRSNPNGGDGRSKVVLQSLLEVPK